MKNWAGMGRKSTSLRATVGSVAIYKSTTTVAVLVQTATSLALLAVTYADAVR